MEYIKKLGYIINGGKMSKILLFIILIFTSGFISYSDIYYDISEAFSIFEDPNTGLTILPTLLIPLGGRFEGMGTAFTAMANDSGFIESNPAGSAMLEKDEISLHHHSWIADSNLEGIVYSSRIHNLGFGMAGKFLFLPFTHYGDWAIPVSQGVISETIGILNVSYNFFKNYYFSGLAVGLNVKGAFRHVPEVIYPDQSIAAGMIDMGLLTRFNLLKFFSSRSRNFSIGLAAKNIGIQSGDDPLPMVFSTGIAYSFIKPLTLAIDFNLPFSFNPEQYPAEKWNIAAGIDINITNFVSVQTGFQLKENPHVSLGCAVKMSQFSIVTNYNLDLSGSFNPIDKFSVEVKIRLGHREEIKKQQAVDKLFAQGLKAYANGNYLLALDFWEKTLDLDPTFLIAQKYIDITKKYIELQEEMENKQEDIKEED